MFADRYILPYPPRWATVPSMFIRSDDDLRFRRLMKNRALVLSTTILFLVAAAAAPAQEKPQAPPPAQGRGNMGRPIVLGPDDVRAFPDAPPGFNTRRADVPAGRIAVSYTHLTLPTNREV